MPTPIRRRFKVDTLLLDKTAPVAVLDVAALISKDDTIFGSDRYKLITEDTYKTIITNTASPEYEWAQAYFGQALKPDSGLLVHWNNDAPETVEAALDDAVSKGAAWYALCYVGTAAADEATMQDIAEYNQSFEEKTQTVLVTNEVNNKTLTTGIGYVLRSLSLERTSVIFHPTGTVNGVDLTGQRPDAALLGRMLSTDEGAEQWDYKALSFVADSGLTASEQENLRANGCNFVERFDKTTFTHVFPGRTVTDREIRIQWGADWFDVNVQASLANYAFGTPLMAFDDDTFTDVEGIIRFWGKNAEARRIIKKDSLVVDLPDPDTIPASTRASGKAQFNNVYTATLNSAIDSWKVQGTWSVGGV